MLDKQILIFELRIKIRSIHNGIYVIYIFSQKVIIQSVSNSRKAAANYKEQLALRRMHDPVTSLTNELYTLFIKSAKRRLKAISGRENRWMSDVNHQISKTLVERYGEDTLFVLEDLTGVSVEERNLSRTAKQNYDLRSWSFYVDFWR